MKGIAKGNPAKGVNKEIEKKGSNNWLYVKGWPQQSTMVLDLDIMEYVLPW